MGNSGNKEYTQPLAGGAEVSIALPNNISQTTTTTITVNNVPTGAEYTFVFPQPTPVTSANEKANLLLQADNNLTVRTTPSPCVIDATHQSCSLVFDTTGTANGTYQVIPHYTATGTIDKSYTALTSFNVTVAGSSPVNNIAPFLVSTCYGGEGGCDSSSGDIYTYKNGALVSVMQKPVNSNRDSYGLRFANIDNIPIYMSLLFNNDTGVITSYQYSNNGYSWKSGNLFACGKNEVNDIEAYQSMVPNAILGYCDNGSNITKLYSTRDGITWTQIWQSSIDNILPNNWSGFFRTFDDNYYINNDFNNYMYKLNKTSSKWESYPMNGLPDINTAYCGGIVTDGQRFVLTCNDVSQRNQYRIYYSNDYGHNWNFAQSVQLETSDTHEIDYFPNLHKYSINNNDYISNDGVSWQKTTTNNLGLAVFGFNNQVGFVAASWISDYNKIYFGQEVSNNFTYNQVATLSSIAPDLLIDWIEVGY